MPTNTEMKRVGILTGGGDCPGLNAVIRAVVKTATVDYGVEAYGIKDGYDGLVRDRMEPLSYDDVSGILTVGGTILGASNKANPFEYYHPDDEIEGSRDMSDQCVANFRSRELDALICIGGDGTLSIGKSLQEKGIPVVGVPKTIDNDVCETDLTFGFDTAVQIVANAIDRLHTTAQSHHRVMVVETMGRYVGWLALHGGIAGGGDVILIPEIDYTLDSVCRAIRTRQEQGRNFSIIVVSEGVKTDEGAFVSRAHVEESTDKMRLGGIGVWLANAIEKKTDIESRSVVLGHLQRGGTPTARDRVLATRYGSHAMVNAANGHFGTMVALHGESIESVDLEKVANRQRSVDPDGALVRTARSVGTYFGDESA
ncbi:MAG: 6-phosphofructokinase [Planctomycetota bacterium]